MPLLTMLPNFETCRRHILAYKRKAGNPRLNSISFPVFWNYKTGLESTGQNILDEKNIANTASMLQGLLLYLKIRNSSLADVNHVKDILRNVRPYYADIRGLELGSGKIHLYRGLLESMYERLGSKINNGDTVDPGFSIVSKSAILMAIWGQVPRFDSQIRRRFEKWTHWPSPEKLPHLNTKEIWYQPDEFGEIVMELDNWVAAWPNHNYSKCFENSFFDLCPGIPPGRQIDIVYHWKLPESWVDYRLQTQGSFMVPTFVDTINEYNVG
jgi:hypothetical protein